MLERGFWKCLNYKRSNIISQNYFEFGISELKGIAGTGFVAQRDENLALSSKRLIRSSLPWDLAEKVFNVEGAKKAYT